MPSGRCINPIPVVIQPIDKPNTFYDADASEEIKTVARKTTVNITGQVRFRNDQILRKSSIGFIEGSAGYIVVSKSKMTKLSYAPDIGDKITSIGNTTRNFFVMGTRPFGHMTRRGGYGFMAIDFSDSQPRKKSV